MFAQVVRGCVRTCFLSSTFWTESARPSRPGSVQTWSKARALVSVNKLEDFSPAGSLLQGRLHTPSTLCYSWSQTLKIISDGEPCAYDDQGVPSLWAEPVCPSCRAERSHNSHNSRIRTPVHTNFEAQITQSPTSVQKYFKKPFSHYWVTFYRKRQIRAPCSVCVCSLISSWQRELSSAEPQTERCLGQSSVKKEVLFPNLQYYGTYSIQF